MYSVCKIELACITQLAPAGPEHEHTSAESLELQHLLKRRELAWMVAGRVLVHWNIVEAAVHSVRRTCEFPAANCHFQPIIILHAEDCLQTLHIDMSATASWVLL